MDLDFIKVDKTSEITFSRFFVEVKYFSQGHLTNIYQPSASRSLLDLIHLAILAISMYLLPPSVPASSSSLPPSLPSSLTPSFSYYIVLLLTELGH